MNKEELSQTTALYPWANVDLSPVKSNIQRKLPVSEYSKSIQNSNSRKFIKTNT